MGGWFGGNPTAPRVAHEVVEAQRPGVLDQHPEDAAATREITDRSPFGSPIPNVTNRSSAWPSRSITPSAE